MQLLLSVVGVIPELKYPAFHNRQYAGAHYMEDELLRILRQYGYPLRTAEKSHCNTMVNGNTTSIECGDVIIQSFEMDSLRYIRNHTDRDLMLPIDYDHDLYTPKGMDEVAQVANYYGLWKENLNVGVQAVILSYGRTWNQSVISDRGGFIAADKFGEEAHKRKLKLALYTVYDSREPSLRNCSVKCALENKTDELFRYFRLGVDNMFVENIPEARELRIRFDYEMKIAMAVQSMSSKLQISFCFLIVFLSSWVSSNAN